MEVAKQKVSEYLEEAESFDETLDPAVLKKEINNLFFTYGQDDLTLREIEAMAMVVYEMVYNPEQFVRVKNE